MMRLPHGIDLDSLHWAMTAQIPIDPTDAALAANFSFQCYGLACYTFGPVWLMRRRECCRLCHRLTLRQQQTCSDASSHARAALTKQVPAPYMTAGQRMHWLTVQHLRQLPSQIEG